MSLALDRLSYKESTTSKGNPYHECRIFRNSAFLVPIYSVGFDSFTGTAINAALEKSKIPASKYKWLTFLVGAAADIGIFYGVGKIIDTIITKRRIHKADELAEKQKA